MDNTVNLCLIGVLCSICAAHNGCLWHVPSEYLLHGFGDLADGTPTQKMKRNPSTGTWSKHGFVHVLQTFIQKETRAIIAMFSRRIKRGHERRKYNNDEPTKKNTTSFNFPSFRHEFTSGKLVKKALSHNEHEGGAVYFKRFMHAGLYFTPLEIRSQFSVLLGHGSSVARWCAYSL